MKNALRGLPLLFSLSACEQVIEPDLPEHTPRLVLQAFFTPDSTWVAFVGRSAGILEALPERERAVAEATVELLAGDRVIDELEFFEGERVYVWEKGALQAGESYSLRVSAPGFATIQATDAIPRPVPTAIASYRTNTSSRSESRISGDFSIKLEIQDPPGETNYYQIRFFRSGHRLGRYEEPFEEPFEEPVYTVEESFSTQDPSISADNDVDDLIEGLITAPFFKDTLFDGQTHAIELSGDYDAPEHTRFYIQVLYVSETYYEYLKSARLHESTQDNPFAEPVSVYSNVENGYGIFAGYSSQIFELVLE